MTFVAQPEMGLLSKKKPLRNSGHSATNLERSSMKTKLLLTLTSLLGLLTTTASAGHRHSGNGLAHWSAGSMPPISGNWGQSNYYGAGGLEYGHPRNRIYGSTPPLSGWVLYQDSWGRQFYQWGPLQNGCR